MCRDNEFFFGIEGGDRDLAHACERCGATVVLDFSVDAIEIKRATKAPPYPDEENEE